MGKCEKMNENDHERGKNNETTTQLIKEKWKKTKKREQRRCNHETEGRK